MDDRRYLTVRGFSGICVTRRILFRHTQFSTASHFIVCADSLLFGRFKLGAGMGFTVLTSPDTEFTDFLVYYDMIFEFRCFRSRH